MRQATPPRSNARSLKLAILVFSFALFFVSSLTAQQPLLTQHVNPEVANGQVPRLALVPEDQNLKLSLMLPLRNEPQLDELIGQLYDPHSPLYHQWLSVQEFTDRFGPTQEDFAAVVEFAKANNMKITVTPANRRLVGVEGAVASVNRAFHVTMGVYQHPYEQRTFFAPDREPTIDLSVPLLYIAGLSNFATAHSMLHYNASTVLSQNETAGSGPGGAYYGSDMRAAYYGGTALTGTGQSIGIYGADYNIGDIEAYFKSAGQSFNPSTVQDYSADGTVNSCGSGCDDGEPVADITESLSMAPGVTSVTVYFGASQEEIFNEMASTNTAKQLSTSILYKYSPDPGTSFDSIFKQFAAQGQNLFAASGDSGAYNTLSGSESNTPWFPTDDPYVTSAGGTDLTTASAGGAWKSETAWVGSGGGLDTYQSYPIPSYQQLSGVIDSANQGSTTIRNIPDVAIDANTDSWYCINGNACTCCLGGTSLAAPRWAGFMALVNEQAEENGKSSIGFLNPTIYAIGTGSSYTSDFHDITTGNNDNSGGGFNAVAGYDLVTGWGSPNGQNFINALTGTASPSFTLSSSSATLNVTQGSSGTTTITVTGADGFTGNVTLSATGLPGGVTATFSPNPATGTSTLTLAASAAAAAGLATVTIQGTSGSLTASTIVAVTVAASATADFTLASSPTSLTLAQGGSGTTTIAVTPLNGFTGSVTFLATGLPTGVTATFSPNPTTKTGTLTLTAASTASPGASTVTINGTSGSLTASTTVTVTVAASATANFTLASSPTSLTVAQGGSGTTTISVTPQNGFTGSVALSATGLPTGVTATFSPSSATATSTLTLAASSTATAGSATVTIQGASGSLSQTVTLPLTVSAATSASTFSLALSQNSVTLTPAQTASLQVDLSGSSGYQGTVQLSCTGLPSNITCSFNPASVTLPASNAVSILTLTDTSTTAAVAPQAFGTPWPLELSWCALGLLGIARARRRIRRSTTLSLLAALVLGLGLLGTTACTRNQGTFTATITGLDANKQTHSQTLTVIVSKGTQTTQ